MKPFRFPLESLRVLRQQKENLAQQTYANALTACGLAETALATAAAELAAGWNAFSHELFHGDAASKIAATRTWCMGLEIRRHERQAAVNEAHRVAETAFQEMLAAVRDREALDKFYDKSRLAHNRDAQREEQKSFDEMAVQSSGINRLLQLARTAH